MKPLRTPRLHAITTAFFLLLVLCAAFGPRLAVAQDDDAPDPAGSATARSLYTKSEFYIRMRDGVRLYTVVFTPKDHSKRYPILLTRTPYGLPYGPNSFPPDIGPSTFFTRSGYIVAYQDVRGTHLSEGNFVNVRPELPPHHGPKEIDESTDTFDTIDYLVKKTPNNNGRVGMWGISYPGFYTDCGAICGHPALVAVSPQAPLTDWFLGDDDNHNGAFYLMDNFDWEWDFDFDYPRAALTTGYPQPHHEYPTADAYQFYLQMGPLKNANDRYLKNTVPYWNEQLDHDTYDSYWQVRSLFPHLTDVHPAVLTVGGWFDAEDFYGTLQTYRTITAKSADTANFLVLGPWPHGGWAGGSGRKFGGLDFGAPTGAYYREKIEFPFFEYYLKGIGAPPAAGERARVFDTGTKQWLSFDSWPPHGASEQSLFLDDQHTLGLEKPKADPIGGFDSYTSDPANPVPYSAHARTQSDRFTPYMAEDQSFVDSRPDVLTYRSAPLGADTAAAGPITADLYVSTTGTDTDFVVKVMDLYPAGGDAPADAPLAGKEILVRAEVMRGKFRDSYTNPSPFKPRAVTRVRFTLQDVCHTFKKGHRIAVQVQSSWFPLVDRNPQVFLHIPKAKDSDFHPADIRVYRSAEYPSRVVLTVR